MNRYSVNAMAGLVLMIAVLLGAVNTSVAQPQELQLLSTALNEIEINSVHFDRSAPGNGYAYLNTDDGFKVLDITDPANPVICASLPGATYATPVVVCDGQALINTGDEFQMIDLTDPSDPQVLGSFVTNLNYRGFMELEGDNAYIGVGYGAVRVVDVQDPSNPEVGPLIPGTFDCVKVRGTTAYTRSDNYLRIYDWSDPTDPELLSSTMTGYESTHSIAVGNGHVFIGNRAELCVYDVSIPSAPQLVHTETIYGQAQFVSDLAVYGDRLGLWCEDLMYYEDEYFRGYDISDPRVPEAVYYSSYFSAVGNDFTVAVNNIEIRVSVGLDPQYAGSLYLSQGARDVVRTGDIAVGQGGNLTVLVDVTDPEAPVEIGWISGTYGSRMAARDGRLYLAVSEDQGDTVVHRLTTYLVESQDPLTPVSELSWITTGTYDSIRGISCSGGFVAVITSFAPQLLLYDTADPYNPVLAGSYTVDGDGKLVAADGDLVAMVHGAGTPQTLLVLDVSDLASPQVVHSGSSVNCPTGLALSGNTYAMRLDNDAGVKVNEIGEVGSSHILQGTYGRKVALNDNLLAVKCVIPGEEFWVEVLDVSDAGDVEPVGVVPEVYYSGCGLHINDGLLMIANDTQLMLVDSSPVTGVDDEHSPDVAGGQPLNFELTAVYPNPFNGQATVTVELPRAMALEIAVSNLLGQRVGTLASDRFGPGRHEIALDATGWASGTYLVHAATDGGERVMRRITLVK